MPYPGTRFRVITLGGQQQKIALEGNNVVASFPSTGTTSGGSPSFGRKYSIRKKGKKYGR